ncbi:hypothetical protein GNY93_10365 [Glaesserella parasuis]|uniref:minor capsid protein n=2 Tax=Glaesserella parasuis TaxID=738 RepID=UPI00136E6E1D|nr:minor capsid protein [Glaesserella parasuis]MXO46577.1 hypothetical protein [Glaesserella parasuis]
MTLSSQDKPKQSLNSRIAYTLTDRKILHFRYDAHLRQQVMKQLSKTQRELLNRLAAAGVDALPKKQLDTLLKELKQEVAKVYQEMTAYTQDELSGFFTAETKHIHQLYNDEVGFDFFNQVPEYKQKANKTATIIAGSPLEDWWAKQGNDFAFKFEGIIRQGLLDGQQTSQMITDVKHLMNTSRRHAETLVITAVAKVADKAHQALRDENLDILAGEKHLSTLDTRTSTVCQLRDGLMWDLDKKPIDHDVPYQRPPLHPRCRSILQLVTKSWKELGIDAEEMPSSTRASQDGPVSEQINYENWLKSKSPEQQDQVLGKGKADLWRRGVITFADMLDQSGRPLTLANLNAKFNTQDGVIKQMRSNWSDDFPDTVIDRKLGEATSHPLYELAKRGDIDAAYHLAKDLVSDEAIEKLRKIIAGRNVIIVPVHAEEAVGRNMIPVATATVLAKKLNVKVDLSIVQATKVSRTAGDGWHRLIYSPAFDGEYPKGQLAIILDDTQTQGGTLASLKGYIEQQNGKVVGAYALTGKQYSVQLRLSKETLNQLREKYGSIEHWWTEEFGYDFSKLTEWEARFILNSRKTADEVRNTIIARKQA